MTPFQNALAILLASLIPNTYSKVRIVSRRYSFYQIAAEFKDEASRRAEQECASIITRATEKAAEIIREAEEKAKKQAEEKPKKMIEEARLKAEQILNDAMEKGEKRGEEDLARVMEQAKHKSEWEVASIIAEAKQMASQITMEARGQAKRIAHNPDRYMTTKKEPAPGDKGDQQFEENEIVFQLPHTKRFG